MNTDEPKQQVQVYATAKEVEQSQGHERANFAERTSDLPERGDGTKTRDGEQLGRQNDNCQPSNLTPRQQYIPPLDFIQRHSQNMTNDRFAAAIANKDAQPPLWEAAAQRDQKQTSDISEKTGQDGKAFLERLNSASEGPSSEEPQHKRHKKGRDPYTP